MAMLYLTLQGTTLQKERGRFRIECSGQDSLDVPIREVEQVLLFGSIHLTTAAIATCLYHQIPVVFLSQSGSYKGHLWSAEGEHLRVETAQFRRFDDAAFQMNTAIALVEGKLWNSRQLLLKLNRQRKSESICEAIDGIERDLRAIAQLPSDNDRLEQLRGYEGAAAARYFPALGHLILHPDFSLTQRTRRPPTDPINSLLSFGYTLLFNNVLSLLRVEGFNPYLGNLHRSDRAEPHLASDLVEEWRSPIVDTLMLKLVNQRIFNADDFLAPNKQGGVYLTDVARRRFLAEFETRITTKVRHADAQKPVTYRHAIVLQIRRYKRWLLDDVPYQSFRRAT